MFVMGNFLIALANLLSMVFGVFKIILFIRVIISWVNPDPFNPIVQFLYRATEPFLQPLRRVIPPLGMLDMSVLAAFMILVFLDSFLVASLIDLGLRMKY